MLLKGTEQWPPQAATSSPAFNVSASGGIQMSSYDDDDDDDGDDYDKRSSLISPRRKPEDDMLYIILGVIVGAILIGVLAALFVCARQQHKQRRLLGTGISLPL